MKQQVGRKKGRPFTMWALIVLIIFFVFVILYVIFNKSYEVVDFPDSRKIIKKDNITTVPKDPKTEWLDHYSTTTCYEGIYLRNVYLITSLYIDFYKGYGLEDNLSVVENTDLKDEYLDQAIKYLRSLTNSKNADVTEGGIKATFSSMRQNILKMHDKEKFQDSPLLKSLFNAISFYKKGQYALDAGGVDAVMERAQIALDNNDINEAYHMVLSLQDPYKEVTSGWLQNVGLFIRTKEILEDTRRYVHSERYSKRFMKLCGQ